MRIMVMRWLDVGSIPKQRRRIFALDGSFSGSNVFSNIYFFLSLTSPRKTMLNTMVIIKMNKCTYDEWKKAFDADSASDAQFMRDVIVGKVDDNTTICSMDVFDS